MPDDTFREKHATIAFYFFSLTLFGASIILFAIWILVTSAHHSSFGDYGFYYYVAEILKGLSISTLIAALLDFIWKKYSLKGLLSDAFYELGIRRHFIKILPKKTRRTIIKYAFSSRRYPIQPNTEYEKFVDNAILGLESLFRENQVRLQQLTTVTFSLEGDLIKGHWNHKYLLRKNPGSFFDVPMYTYNDAKVSVKVWAGKKEVTDFKLRQETDYGSNEPTSTGSETTLYEVIFNKSFHAAHDEITVTWTIERAIDNQVCDAAAIISSPTLDAVVDVNCRDGLEIYDYIFFLADDDKKIVEEISSVRFHFRLAGWTVPGNGYFILIKKPGVL
ncbi:MAG: hypothetical protein LUC93_03140 [Planctomycetaceae bacterium]|nr:hypothetical protein [Planctomycetaceae bacterium]